MRKIVVSIFALLVSSMTLMAERVSREDASLVANHFMNVAAPSSVDGVKRIAPAKRMVLKQTSAQTENQYYVYENENGEGWVIISANDAVRPILAYSETGHFPIENMPSNLRKWMGKYDKFIKRIETDNVEASEETQALWDELRQDIRRAQAAVVVGPLIKTKWDQDTPFNHFCPGYSSNKAYTGCVATAMAQVMKYWEWPINGTGSHSYKPLDVNNPFDEWTGEPNYSQRYTSTLSANFETTTYDWENMINDYSGSYNNTQRNAVATLMYHCGVATEMMYGNDADGGSGTMTHNYGDWDWGITTTDEGGIAQNAFYAFFKYKKPIGYVRDGIKDGGYTYYKKWSDADWTAMIKEELDQQRPLMYGGASDEGDHSFICDGYNSMNYFHFNWGWSGDGDGYFSLSNLNPGSGGAGGGSYSFSEDQDVLIGIEPDRQEPEAIENIETTTSAQKTIYNGMVVIVRDNILYDLMGQKIQ